MKSVGQLALKKPPLADTVLEILDALLDIEVPTRGKLQNNLMGSTGGPVRYGAFTSAATSSKPLDQDSDHWESALRTPFCTAPWCRYCR